MSDEFETEACDFIGPEECEERLDEKGVSIGDAADAHFREFDEGK